ncbi:hypothetical protein RSOLAG22IIIB_04576 [Rhizoctonia solani]|uniref:Uncharacterized protein n=1 Tax=Rhizoctonia solani TaxID=456999 RepID=A0A0K6FYP2_9AGAM|nr:hypothetical protein RSOLAG22IIIB_04576 [Rhizoctonia solani]
MVVHMGFMSYLSQSFVPCKFSRLCILGVDIVGIPVVLVVGLPQSKALAVAGWFGLRVALTGLCYLEYRWDLATRSSQVENTEEKVAAQLPAASPPPELPVTIPEPAAMHDEKAPIDHESGLIEFPCMDRDLAADADREVENGGRTERKISLRSVDSDDTIWSECETPAQMTVELPVVELTEEPVDAEVPERWVGAVQEEVLVKPAPEPVPVPEPEPKLENKIPSPRRKRSKYGGCPLVMRKSTASLCVSAVTAKTEAT